MFLRSINRTRKTLGFRLTLWYSGIFILSCLIVFLVSYIFLFSSLHDNRELIRSQLMQYLAQIEETGLQSFQHELDSVQHVRRRTTFFVRVIGPANKTDYLSHPRLWQKFQLDLAQSRPADGEWRYFPAVKDGDMLEVLSADLPGGALLQVGKIIQAREEILERFRETILAVTIPMILIGMAGGSFLAFRALRPVHKLSNAVRSIIDTAKVDARVPVSGTDDELNELIRLFNQMLHKIEVLIRGMREALDNVAHDLRTPMTRLRGIAEQALQSRADPEACREALADCIEESERVITMLNTLMDISEAEAGTMKLSLQRVNVSDLVADVSELYHYVAEEKNIVLTADVSKDLYLFADPDRMRQVLANLLDNAIKYTPGGGRVVIEAFQNGEQVTVLFKDTGIGIPAEEVPRIWDRLYRGDKSRSQRGLGLGLSLVKAVVQAHKGHVEACQNPGGGSLIALYLSAGRAI